VVLVIYTAGYLLWGRFKFTSYFSGDSTMDTVDKHLTALGKYPNNFDALSQQFVGGSFYGLEYVLEDFFQHTQ
jgi:hypothetical protein